MRNWVWNTSNNFSHWFIYHYYFFLNCQSFDLESSEAALKFFFSKIPASSFSTNPPGFADFPTYPLRSPFWYSAPPDRRLWYFLSVYSSVVLGVFELESAGVRFVRVYFLPAYSWGIVNLSSNLIDSNRKLFHLKFSSVQRFHIHSSTSVHLGSVWSTQFGSKTWRK